MSVAILRRTLPLLFPLPLLLALTSPSLRPHSYPHSHLTAPLTVPHPRPRHIKFITGGFVGEEEAGQRLFQVIIFYAMLAFCPRKVTTGSLAVYQLRLPLPVPSSPSFRFRHFQSKSNPFYFPSCLLPLASSLFSVISYLPPASPFTSGWPTICVALIQALPPLLTSPPLASFHL